VERPLSQIHEALQRLVGLHRQLLDTVRMEREALVQADAPRIQEATCAKQALIEAIRQAESERLKRTGELALLWKKPLRELTITNIVLAIQGVDPKSAEQFRSIQNTLVIMVQRISDQNRDNQTFVERSLEHVKNMKKNVLGESAPKTNTYTQQGQRSNPVAGARLISKEA